jgi:hypothetical protein
MMQTIQIKKVKNINLEDLVLGVSQLDELNLAVFFVQLNEKIMESPRLNRLSQESLLLRKIKQVIPASVLRQYRNLRKKAREQVIAEPEKRELLLLSDFIEEKTVEKINLLAELAKLRQVPLATVLQEFAIQSLI